MMLTLLHKELRLAADVFVGALIFLVASFPLACAGVAMQGVRPFPWLSAIVGGCVLNQYTMVLTGALLGAVAFAREREEGSIHFLVALPLRPARHYTAKVAGGALLWAALWLVNGVLLAGVVVMAGLEAHTLLPFLGRMLGTAFLSWAAFGLAAFAGARIASVTGAALAAAACLMIVVVVRLVSKDYTGADTLFSIPFLIALAVLGTLMLGLAGRGDHLVGNSRVSTGKSGDTTVVLEATWHGHRGPWAALLWKDLRLMRMPLVLGTVLFALPFLAALGHALHAGDSATTFRAASLLNMALGWIILPLWSGSSMASEWAAGTDAFLAALPLRNSRNIASKFLTAGPPSAALCAVGGAVFLLAERHIPGEPSLTWDLTWDAFNNSGFLPGAVAYSCAQPVTFAVAWYLAARTQRKTIAIVVGVIAGPVAMAAWAVSGGPGGILAGRLLPVPAIMLHATALAGVSGLLILMGARLAFRQQI